MCIVRLTAGGMELVLNVYHVFDSRVYGAGSQRVPRLIVALTACRVEACVNVYRVFDSRRYGAGSQCVP